MHWVNYGKISQDKKYYHIYNLLKAWSKILFHYWHLVCLPKTQLRVDHTPIRNVLAGSQVDISSNIQNWVD